MQELVHDILHYGDVIMKDNNKAICNTFTPQIKGNHW